MTRNAPAVLLAGALAAAGALTLALTWQMTFYQDTWDYLINRRAITVDTLLIPHNEHIVAIPIAIEQLLLRLFGMTTATPEYVLMTVALLVTAYLLFVYVKRRVGPWLALFATVLLLFLGPAWEVLLWPFELCFVGSVLFGIAMLLALERDDRRGDIAACVFLVLSFGFSSLGIAFAAAAVVSVFQGRRGQRLGRAYLFAVPLALYAAWYVGWGHNAETHLSLHNVLASPRFVVEAMATTVGSVLGLGPSPYGEATNPVWGGGLLIVLVIALAYRQLRKPGFSPGLWPVAAATAAYWFLAAFNQFSGRAPGSSRYQYAGAILLFMLLANLLQGARVSRRVLLVGGVVTLAAGGPNLVVLKEAKNTLQQQTVFTRADTAAIEIARRTVDPEFELTPEISGTPSLVNVYAGSYLTAVEEYGSPAYSPDQLASAPEEGRRQADIVLSQALPLSTVTRLRDYSPDSAGSENCVSLPAGSTSPTSELRLPLGLTRIELAPGPHAAFNLRRFAVGEFPVVTGGARGNSVTLLRIPRDNAPQPWYLHVEASQQARICR